MDIPERHKLVGGRPGGNGHRRYALPAFRATGRRSGRRRRLWLHHPVDRGIARGLESHADAIGVRGCDVIANLDLVEPRGTGRRVQRDQVALRPSNRHRTVRMIDCLDSAFERHLALGVRRLRLRHRYSWRRHKYRHTRDTLNEWLHGSGSKAGGKYSSSQCAKHKVSSSVAFWFRSDGR